MLLQALFIVGLIHLSLLLLPFRVVQRFTANALRTDASLPQTARADYQQRVVRAVRAVARRMLGDRPCLSQALAVQWFLGRAGWETELHIGVVKQTDQALAAHAWLEGQGEVLIGGRSSRVLYTRLHTIRSRQGSAQV
jgi:hypothetical protein